jgi:5'-nucleotidase / UDP-sugar diphosphatase
MKTIRTILAAVIGVGLLLVAYALLFQPPAEAEGQTNTTLTTAGSDIGETNFGDLTADAIRDAAGADLALVAAISFKTGSLGPGALTAERIGSLLANPDELWAVLRLKGGQIEDALEHSVRSAPQPASAFLQVSGLAFEYSVSAERGSRVRDVRVGTAGLNQHAEYTVAMPLSLAKGGSGYFTVFGRTVIERQGTVGLATTIAEYANRQGRVSYSGTGRITAQP